MKVLATTKWNDRVCYIVKQCSNAIPQGLFLICYTVTISADPVNYALLIVNCLDIYIYIYIYIHTAGIEGLLGLRFRKIHNKDYLTP